MIGVLVYVASPLGFTHPTKAWYDAVLVPAVEAGGHQVLDPWSASADLFDGVTDPADLAVANAAAAQRNEDLIRSCDAVLAVLDGVDVDSGTAAEIGFAYALGKLVVGWRSDFRLAGDNAASVVNLQIEHFLRGPVERDLETALMRLR
ncbi:MAG: nucleoside 2-deoxyribosyltransferase [Frankiales bacterium]|nr:nucleoside 2-deoxyribosyltransferase [Frankiales bacterium]